MSSEWHGNLINRVLEAKGAPEPMPGMGATKMMWSDRKAYHVTRVSPTGRTVWIRRAEVTPHRDDHGVLRFDVSPGRESRPEEAVRQDRHGRWKVLGSGIRVMFGYADEYFDEGF